MTEASVVLVGSLDTKADEYRFVRDRIAAAGLRTTLLDTGVLGTPGIAPDVDSLARTADRNGAMTAMASGAAAVVAAMCDRDEVLAVLALGGSNAGYVMGEVSARVPFGIPKLLVSTIVAGDTRPYVGTADLTMMYPVVDLAGLNSISRPILAAAADACIGMVSGAPVDSGARGPVIGMTMFGVTTACVTAVEGERDAAGDECHVFHANGTGGRTLEAMIRSGRFAAVADITTTELADELFGGVCSAGPDRQTAAADTGVPQVISAGAMDMVNFGPVDTVPDRYSHRQLLAHNPHITLMRTDAAECRQLGLTLADRANRATAFTEVHLPALGFSQIAEPNGPFHDAAADRTLIDAVRERLDDRIPLFVHESAINHPAFAHEISLALTRALDSRRAPSDELTH